jgi:hypothetical protein
VGDHAAGLSVFGRRRRRIDRRQNRFIVRMDAEERALLRQLLGELRQLLALSPDDPRVRRLYPAAYSDDPERESEYVSLTREELQSGRLASIDAVEASVDTELLDADHELLFDPSDPNARTVALYGYLGGLLDEIVDAQL